MVSAMAAPEEPGLQPRHMANWPAFFFFVAFVLVVAYTLLNLYIGERTAARAARAGGGGMRCNACVARACARACTD